MRQREAQHDLFDTGGRERLDVFKQLLRRADEPLSPVWGSPHLRDVLVIAGRLHLLRKRRWPGLSRRQQTGLRAAIGKCKRPAGQTLALADLIDTRAPAGIEFGRGEQRMPAVAQPGGAFERTLVVSPD